MDCIEILDILAGAPLTAMGWFVIYLLVCLIGRLTGDMIGNFFGDQISDLLGDLVGDLTARLIGLLTVGSVMLLMYLSPVAGVS